MASGFGQFHLTRPQGNMTSDTSGDRDSRQQRSASLGLGLDSGYETDYEIKEDDPVFEGYGLRICDNDENFPDDDDLTASHIGQIHWRLSDLPDILYVLQPREEDAKSEETLDVIDHPVFSSQKIREFAVLPDLISSKVEGWRVIAWLRLDARIKLRDIVDRMNPKIFRDLPLGYSQKEWYMKVLSRVALRCKKTYEDFNIVRWWNEDTRHLDHVIELLETAQIDTEMNTTRGITPGLIDPARGEPGGRIPILGDQPSYETVWRPVSHTVKRSIPNEPEYPKLPGEESDEEETHGTPKGNHRSSQSKSSTPPGQDESGVIYSDPTNTNPPVDPSMIGDSAGRGLPAPGAISVSQQLVRDFQAAQAARVHEATKTQQHPGQSRQEGQGN